MNGEIKNCYVPTAVLETGIREERKVITCVRSVIENVHIQILLHFGGFLDNVQNGFADQDWQKYELKQDRGHIECNFWTVRILKGVVFLVWEGTKAAGNERVGWNLVLKMWTFLFELYLPPQLAQIHTSTNIIRAKVSKFNAQNWYNWTFVLKQQPTKIQNESQTSKSTVFTPIKIIPEKNSYVFYCVSSQHWGRWNKEEFIQLKYLSVKNIIVWGSSFDKQVLDHAVVLFYTRKINRSTFVSVSHLTFECKPPHST